MRFGKSALSALLLVSSAGLAAGPAHADAVGTGTVSFLGTSCAFTYDWDGGPPPAPLEIRSVAVGADCAAQGTASGTVTFTGGNSTNFALDIDVVSPIPCSYSGSLQGTFSGTTSDYPEQALPETTGNPDCPNPALIAITTG